MPAILAPEMPPNIVAITEIEEEAVESIAAPSTTQHSHGNAMCYLCPPDAFHVRTETRCYYCDKLICSMHNPGYLGWCFVQIDACPECAAKQTEEHYGFNGSHRPNDSELHREAVQSQKRHRAAIRHYADTLMIP